MATGNKPATMRKDTTQGSNRDDLLKKAAAKVLPQDINDAIDQIEVEVEIEVQGHVDIDINVHKKLSLAKLIGFIAIITPLIVAMIQNLQ